MVEVLSILLNLGKWPTKREGGLHLGWVVESLIGVEVGKPDVVSGVGQK